MEPFTPTVLNMVVDAVVSKWVSLMKVGAGGLEGWCREVLRCATFFYADDGLVVSTDPEWILGAFNTLTGIFDRVGLQTDVNKTVRMI